MTHCPNKLKLNAYRNVKVPTVRQLYSRFGERTKLSGFTTSLKDMLDAEPVPMSEPKLTAVSRAVSYALSLKDDLPE